MAAQVDRLRRRHERTPRFGSRHLENRRVVFSIDSHSEASSVDRVSRFNRGEAENDNRFILRPASATRWLSERDDRRLVYRKTRGRKPRELSPQRKWKNAGQN